MKIQLIIIILLLLVVNCSAAQEDSITWSTLSSGFQRGHPVDNWGIGLGSIIGQPFVESAISGTDTIISGFAANPDSLFRDVLTPVANKPARSPKVYSLSQNYPNPFNPNTTIRYELPRNSHVVLCIYNILGQVVTRLVDGVQEEGYKSASWNATNVASGIYFLRIEATSTADPSKSFTQVKKMILLK
jgi:hypothetical protein